MVIDKPQVDELLAELQARGVTLTAKDGQLLTTGPKGAITPDLGEQIRARKVELLQALQSQGAPTLAPLPEPLVRLIHAAAGNHLNRPGFLPSGMVMNLGEYVLTSAALYATGRDPDRQLADLWAARGAWAS